MPIPKINFQSKASILKSFDEIAEKFGKEIQLQINDAYYRLVDFEFYPFAKEFEDPHTYKNDLQLQFCVFYLHASGVDITLGDGTNHCGLLIRSIVRLPGNSGSENRSMPQQFSGPQICATEIFSNLHPLDSNKQNIISLVDHTELIPDKSNYPAVRILNTKRVGLTPKPKDPKDEYLNLPLRYIAVLEKSPDFKQSIPGIDTIVGEQLKSEKLTPEEAFEILGYNKKV